MQVPSFIKGSIDSERKSQVKSILSPPGPMMPLTTSIENGQGANNGEDWIVTLLGAKPSQQISSYAIRSLISEDKSFIFEQVSCK